MRHETPRGGLRATATAVRDPPRGCLGGDRELPADGADDAPRHRGPIPAAARLRVKRWVRRLEDVRCLCGGGMSYGRVGRSMDLRAITWTAASLLAVAACAGDYRSGLEGLGRSAGSWHECLRIGATLRAQCRGDETCARSVTNDVTQACYVGFVRAAWRRPTDAPRRWDMPCGLVERTAEQRSRVCANALAGFAGVDAASCAAELAALHALCLSGASYLSGAGP